MMKNVVFVIILVTCFACAGQNEDNENKSVSPVREDIEWLMCGCLIPTILYCLGIVYREFDYPSILSCRV